MKWGLLMGRKIILLSDGTGNSADKERRTNVFRVFESVDLLGSNQVAYYDDGVGTSAFEPAAILGGTFGYGLKRNVIDLYKFACRNFRSAADEMFCFGSGRGAFTIRILVGLILEQGVIQATSEAELDRKARAAYRDYRRRNFHTFWRFPEAMARWLRDLLIRSKYSKDENINVTKIRFIGLWDTVTAYGMPADEKKRGISLWSFKDEKFRVGGLWNTVVSYGVPVEEMTRGISDWLFPLLLPSSHLNRRVVRACHALSIDDERTEFYPALLDERNEQPLKARADGKRYLIDERISQVWFAGMHSNIVGGNPDDPLASIPLAWIMAEAEAAGLVFNSDSDTKQHFSVDLLTARNKDNSLSISRTGLDSYHRYVPRNILELGVVLLSRRGNKAVPKIHESVLQRIKDNPNVYAPSGIPAEYEIIKRSGEVMPPEQNFYENITQAAARARIQEKTWNIIWLRWIVYFLTVLVSVYLVAFPLMKALPRTLEWESPFWWVSGGVKLIGTYLPSAAAPWINGYARDPLRFLTVVVILTALLRWGHGWQRGFKTTWGSFGLGPWRLDFPSPASPTTRFINCALIPTALKNDRCP
jgi:uncharacterized protein (DUF2235 family)